MLLISFLFTQNKYLKMNNKVCNAVLGAGCGETFWFSSAGVGMPACLLAVIVIPLGEAVRESDPITRLCQSQLGTPTYSRNWPTALFTSLVLRAAYRFDSTILPQT